MAKHTGQDIKTIERDTDRDNFLSAEQAVSYGLVDKVLVERRAEGVEDERVIDLEDETYV